jgi:hypothetical protein
VNIRAATIIIAVLDTLAGAAAAWVYFDSNSDPATIGFDTAAGVIVISLLLLTAVPSLYLAFRGRVPRTALALALAFPATFALFFIAAVIIFI